MPGSRPLELRIRERIRADGPISFAAFMEAALYDPDEGYYAGTPIVGGDGDFVTSPHVSPAFGVLLARCVEDLWVRLDRPDPFLLVEAGAGDGTLARRLLASLPDDLALVTEFVAVERGAGARPSLAPIADEAPPVRTFTVAAELGDLRDLHEGSTSGVILANELLDNLPFHRIRGGAGDEAPAELLVDLDGERFVLIERPAPPELLAIAPALAPGREATVSPAAFGLIDTALRLLTDGYVLLVDYATDADGAAQVHGYRRHRVEADVLEAPGTRDITAGVDMAGLGRHAASRGATVWGPLTQRDALLNLGVRAWDAALRDRQAVALGEGRGRDAAAIYSARNAARLLIDAAGLGGFAVLCLGVGRTPRPALLLDGAVEEDADPAP